MQNNRELHYKYGISYLLCAVIALIAFGLFDVPSLVDKVAFAMTIASLVLAIVAIIYTFLAANKRDGQLAKLAETHHSISAAANETKLAAASLLGHVADLPSQLESIDSKIGALARPEATSMTMQERTTSELPELSDIQFKHFIGGLPFASMAVLYAFYVASRNGKSLSETSMANWAPLGFYFAFGVLSTADATGLLSFEYHKDEIVPVACATVLKKDLIVILNQVIDVVSEDRAKMLKQAMELADKEFA